MSTKRLYALIYHKDNYYKSFKIKKRNGTDREIDAPDPYLRKIQKIILTEILYEKDLIHPNCEGFVKGRSIFTNAERHTQQNILWKIDIRDFFPSITTQRVVNTLQYIGFNEFISIKLAELMTYKGRLPQGAPTSPYLSNF